MNLTNIYSRGKKLWRDEGPLELLKGVFRFLYWHTGIRDLNHRIRYQLVEDEIVITVGGIERTFIVESFTEFVRCYTLMNDRRILEDFVSELTRRDSFVDIGANVGIYSAYADSQLESDQIDAFEPHPENIRALNRNLDRNEIQARVHECALAHEEGELLLEPSGEDAGEGEHALTTDRSGSGIEVEVQTLDRVVGEGNASQPTVVKIDVEGAELDVIKGGRETFSSKSCRLVYCEVHPDRLENYGGSYEELQKTLVEYGFELELISGSESGYSTLKATKPKNNL